MENIYLLTGGNIGDRLQNLQNASSLVEKSAGVVLQKSSIYETAAWGYTQQAAFLNQVLRIKSDLSAHELLQNILAIELQMGRKRVEKMGPRVIDIDILFYGGQIISTPELVVPHPRIAQRRFVLTPLAEIAPGFIHPVFNKTTADLLKDCTDQLEVKKYFR